MGISFFLDEPVLTASVGLVPVDVLGTHFDSSFFLEGVVLTASEGAYSGFGCFLGTALETVLFLKGLKALVESSPGSWLLFRAQFGISTFWKCLS